ncbi:para-aminobenzoate synthase [Marinicauda salina]|uniref:Para-aminobenzoate synthase n=1 Tax=Marinicauda salina TaxID=2135793 RepID=A0A2U2BXN3_9PROT|nr:anthranilate synthase component I family protein [Marinicauda salina]PWE18760.1 para-aminobenzoate synthase [Marinicauda salina]
MTLAALAPVRGSDAGWIAPEDALASLRDEPGTLLLHGGGAGERGRFSYLFAFPAFTISETDAAAGFAALQAAGRARRAPGEGFRGGFAGLLSYELGAAFERTPLPETGGAADPVLHMGWYDAVAVFDHQRGEVRVEGEGDAARKLDSVLAEARPPAGLDARGGRLEAIWPEARYLEAAARAVDYVRAGDVFQVNLSHPFEAELGGADAPYAVFRALAEASPAAFAAYLRIDAGRVVVTNSPERFLQVFPDGRVQTRPIKGTRPRGEDPLSDRRLAEALAASEKDRAENLMIVDLMRNDLSRVCAPGTVRAPDLFSVEAFANVHHLVSTVEGRLAAGRDAFDLVAASFPPGSITGAPKLRAMEIIAELEGARRGAYCGAMGWLGADGAADFNVMIRTASFRRHGAGWRVEARSGGAITADSDPAAELAETRAKIAALRAAMEAPA